MLAVICILLIAGIGAISIVPESHSLRRFNYSNDFEEKIHGDLINCRYDLTSAMPSEMKKQEEVDYTEKVWVAIHRIDLIHHQVTVVRLDNILDHFGENRNYKHYPTDCQWREFVGWPTDLKMTIADYPEYELFIPANIDHDVLSKC